MPLFSLRSSQRQRLIVTKNQEREIHQMYKNVYKDVQEKLSKTGDVFTYYQLKDLEKSLDRSMITLSQATEDVILNNMSVVSKSVVEDVGKMFSLSKVEISGAYASVPNDVVLNIATGQVYEGDWTLSNAIWDISSKSREDINKIVAKGIAENKPTYDIAKDLEKYVNPDAKKDWEWSKVYPNTLKKIDYNAQRLARTLVSHAYQQSVIETTNKNPYVDGIEWLSDGGERTCEICEERNGKIYAPEDLPMEHPNGLCSFAVVVSKTPQEIADELASETSKILDEDENYQAYKKWKQEMAGQ